MARRTLATGILTGISGKQDFAAEYRVRHRSGQFIWIHDRCRVLRGQSGAPERVIGMIIDITEQKVREEHVRALMREVSHRAKNMLGVVYAIARQSGSGEPGQFVARMTSRIEALSTYQDLLVRNDWRGVAMNDLARAELAPFADVAANRISCQGPSLQVSAAAAQTLAMALHELATNAGKFGALSTKDGRVEFSWRLLSAETDGTDRFEAMWKELEGPAVSPPSHTGFGYSVLTSMAKLGLNAAVELDFAPGGVTWSLCCLAGNVVEMGAPPSLGLGLPLRRAEAWAERTVS